MRYLEITEDVYLIGKRLKEIDRSYIILYNLDKKSYEVHSQGRGKGSYCFTVPYDILDARTITYTRKTSVERRDKIIEEIEINNQKLYERSIKEQVNKIKEALC